MPGSNCSIFGCPVSRRYKDVSIFKIPSATNVLKAKWRKELINVITRDRVIDEKLRKQIDSGNLFICERHFSSDQLWVYGEKKTMKDDAIPSLNMPVKSVVSPPPVPRSSTSIMKRENKRDDFIETSTNSSCYSSFIDFQTRVNKLKLPTHWNIFHTDSLSTITFLTEDTLLPKFELFVEPCLKFSLRVFGWMLTNDHEIYTKYNRSFLNVTLSSFIP